MKKKLSSSVSVFISCLILLIILPNSSLKLLGMYLRHYGPDPRLLKYFWRSSPSGTIMLFVSLLLIVIMIVSFLQIITYASKLKMSGETKSSARHITEEAINCSHSTGRTKYLEQIDGFLRTGLIDRAEYNVLKARYERLNIPDDYHG